MREQEREEFLEAFAKDNEKTLVGFCIMGGIFSEGIDLDGEKLIGAAVVGAGIPQVGPERELLKQYFDRSGENGFDYAYRYPGMNKVLQAAGRVIRTTEDTGVILYVLLVLAVYVITYPKYTDKDAMVAILAFFYVSLLLSFLYQVRILKYGGALVVMVYICSWINDTFAYCVGVKFGKHKMSPKLSPKKSVEGLLGGILVLH